MENEYLINDFQIFIDKENKELEEIIQNFITYISQLKLSIKNNLNSLVINNNGFQIDRKNEKLFKNVLKYSILVGNKVDTAAFFDKLKLNKEDTVFWSKIENVVGIGKSFYAEANCLRNLPNEKFYKTIENIFINNILSYGDIEESKEFDQEENIGIIRILEFVTTLIIEKCFAKIQFINECKIRFDLDEEKALILWDMIKKHEQQLIHKYLFKRIENISADLKQLKSDVNEINNFINQSRSKKL